jgi:hypothetical protein
LSAGREEIDPSGGGHDEGLHGTGSRELKLLPPLALAGRTEGSYAGLPQAGADLPAPATVARIIKEVDTQARILVRIVVLSGALDTGGSPLLVLDPPAGC